MPGTRTDRIRYDSRIPKNDRNILESREAIFSEAILSQDGLYLTFVEDGKHRKHYRLVKYSEREECFCQLPIDAVSSCDDSELKAKIVAGEFRCIDAAYLRQRVAKWRARVQEVLAQICKWLEHYPECQVSSGQQRQPPEEILSQWGIAAEELPVLDIEMRGRDILVRPHALFTLGANGRIDVVGRRKQWALVDLADDAARERDWRIVSDEFKHNLEPLSRGEFIRVLENS